MTSRLCILTIIVLFYNVKGFTFDNVTSLDKGPRERDSDEVLLNDSFMIESSKSCEAGHLYGCLQNTAGSVLVNLINSIRSDDGHNELDNEVTLVKTNLPSIYQEKVAYTSNERFATNQNNNAFIPFLFRTAERFFKSTGLVLDLNDDVTEGGLYKPRFIDEIYSEIDTLEDKNAKPNRRYEFKRLFIPLLVILKLFKLKLIVFLPILLGLASFKKIIALLILIIPGIIGYLKVCKPDLGHSYGTYGHSSFYNTPPSLKRKQYQEMMHHISRYEYKHEDAHQLAYQANRG